MRGTTFQQLSIFQSIVQEGSIRGAARKLEMAPPSVSHSLKQLENHIRLPLFTRTTRRIELTEAGQLLYDNITGAISDLDYALESVQDLSETPSGNVRVTVPRFVFQFFLKPIYAEFCKQYPDIRLEISVSDAAVDIVKEGFDLGIRFGDRVDPEMVARPLTTPTHEALFASNVYTKEFGLPQKPEDLHQHKLIQYRFMTSNQLAPLLLKDKDQDVNVTMPLGLIVNDTDAMMDAAENGLGIGRIIHPMIQEKIEQDILTPILQDYWYPYPGLYLYFMQNSQKARRVRVLIDFLISKAKG